MKHKIVSFDIETAALKKSYNDLDDRGKNLWIDRCMLRYENELKGFGEFCDAFYQHCWEKYSGITPTFSRIICISVAVFDGKEIHTKSFYDEDERELIIGFLKIVKKFIGIKKPPYLLAGHNIKNFDIPFVIKRAIINGIEYSTLPEHLQISDKKPWDLGYILDTKELWKCGSHLFNETIDETCWGLDIPSPKSSLHGGDVYDYIYKGKGTLQDVVNYCENDAHAPIEILRKIL